jgi:ribonuclease P/MRP protein subunit POP1
LIQSPWETLQTPGGVSTELWDADVRAQLAKPRWKKSALDARRQQQQVPGTRLSAAVNDDRVPVILMKSTIQSKTPGQDAAGFHGWTLVVPHGWSMAFLPSFIYCNARLAGVVERRNRSREAGVPSFPEHYSSVSHASGAWETQQSQEDQVRWLRKPPGKRPEFSVLGTKWPFRPVWNEVLSVS